MKNTWRSKPSTNTKNTWRSKSANNTKNMWRANSVLQSKISICLALMWLPLSSLVSVWYKQKTLPSFLKVYTRLLPITKFTHRRIRWLVNNELEMTRNWAAMTWFQVLTGNQPGWDGDTCVRMPGLRTDNELRTFWIQDDFCYRVLKFKNLGIMNLLRNKVKSNCCWKM
jgi:hypothetical protein